MPKVVSLLGILWCRCVLQRPRRRRFEILGRRVPCQGLLEDPDANVQIAAAYALTRWSKTEYARVSGLQSAAMTRRCACKRGTTVGQAR